MWIARNKDGALRLFVGKPIRWCMNSSEYNIWVDTLGWDDHTAYGFPYTLTFGWESLTWEDDPIEVEIISKSELTEVEKLKNELEVANNWIKFYQQSLNR